MTREDAERWADHGCRPTWEALRPDADEPISAYEVAMAIRSAYVAGYIESLSTPQPTSIAEAVERVEILSVVIPVT